MRSSVERKAIAAGRWLDDLVDQVAVLGFGYRARAEAEINASALTVAALAGGIIVMSASFALLFAGLLIRPIRTATRFAEDIAADLPACVLSTTRRDEIGRLFECLVTMQTNLRARADQVLTFLRQQEQAAETLRRTNLRFEAALNNMSHGLLMYGADATVTVVNRRFGEIYGIDRNMIVAGGSYRDLLALSIAAGNHPNQTVDEYFLPRMHRSCGHNSRGHNIRGHNSRELRPASFRAAVPLRFPTSRCQTAAGSPPMRTSPNGASRWSRSRSWPSMIR